MAQVQNEGNRAVSREIENYNLDAILSVGYRVSSSQATHFCIWATVQNKLHFAMTGKTAAEIIHQRADSTKPNMGLTVWKNAPDGAIRELDVVIAKNYLNEKELDHLNRIVTMYLDFADMQAERGIMMYMKDWVSKLDAFLKFNEREILTDSGKISQEVAHALAMKEYGIYKKEQDQLYESDFDRVVKKLFKKERK